MYEKLEVFNALGCALLERLTPVSSGEISVMRQQWPAAPDEYFAFIQERGTVKSRRTTARCRF